MSRARTFDWEEARRLRAQGWTYVALGEWFGVHANTVYFACNEKARAENAAASRLWQRSGTCPDCGAPATRTGGGRQHRCVKCAMQAKTTVRDGQAHCFTCDEWKSLADFGASPYQTYRGVRSECRACETARRREYRRAHPDREAAAQRKRRQRKAAA